MRTPLLRTVVLALALVLALCGLSPARADADSGQPTRVHSTWHGAAGGVHVVDAQSAQAGSVRLQLAFDYFRGSDYLVLGDTNENLGGALSIAVAAADYLELFGSFQTRSNSNNRGEPVLIQIVGDLRFGVKGHVELLPWFGVGTDLRVALLNNVGDLGIAGAATSFGLRADATADFRRLPAPLPLIARANLDYYFDNSGALVSALEDARYRLLAPSTRRARINEDRNLITRIERLGLGVNRVDMFTLGLGVEAALSPAERWFVHPLLEWQHGVPVNRQGYNCLAVTTSGEVDGDDGCLAVQGLSAAPSVLTLGTRLLPPVRGLSFLFALDIALRGGGDFVRELLPTRPWALLFALAFDSSATPAASAGLPPAVQGDAVWTAGAATPRARVRGIAVDKDSGAPIEGAVVRYPDPNQSAQLTGGDGEFTSYELDPGEARFEFSHPDYDTRTCLAVVATPPAPALAEPAAAVAPAPAGVGLTAVSADSPDGAAAATSMPALAPPALADPLLVPLRCELTARPRLGSVRGLITNAAKAHLAGITVVFAGTVGHTATSDAFGAFVATDLPAGEYSVSVDAAGYLPLRQSVIVVARSASDLPLMLAEAAPPGPALVVVTAREVKIRRQVLFKPNSAEIDARSQPLLSEIAVVLAANPQVKRVQVQGHTDNKGEPGKNLRLSQARAEAVVQSLVAAGLAADRLEAKGFGDSRPLVPNLTPGNRAQNRRVQLLILEQ